MAVASQISVVVARTGAAAAFKPGWNARSPGSPLPAALSSSKSLLARVPWHDSEIMAAGANAAGDVLSRWLSDDCQKTLDVITGEAIDVVGIVDHELKIRYLNWTVPGLTRDSVVGNSVLDLVPPAYREIAQDTYTGVLRTGTGTRFETIYRDEAGFHIFDVRVGPIRFEGEVIGLIVITNNVTEQRREQADRDRFFSLSLDMLVVANPDGRFRRVNPAFSETLGYDSRELCATAFLDFVHPDDRARTHEVFVGALRGERISDFENRYRRKDGEYRVFSWRATGDPATGDVYAVARDITAYRATEAQLRQAQKMEAVGQLAGGIAHDFNNLLLAILANAQLAAESIPKGTDAAESLAEIESAGARAADLTNRLLAFSRRQPFRPVSVDLNKLTRGLMKMLRRLLPESIEVDLVADHDLAAVSADPTQLEQVIVNLCVNARDAMESGGSLTLTTSNVTLDGAYCEQNPWARPGVWVRLSVADTGAGMSAEVRERAFEPFFTTKDAHRGTGLGLSTVYGIVQQHGGMVEVRSELGRGTTFEIYVPADSGLATDVGAKVESPAARGRETILLAEDEERVRRALVQILERAGYRTIAAENGVQAVRLLRERAEPVHLALLDVVMPELGGPETWEQLRSLRSDLRVLFMSGYADDRTLARLPPDAEVVRKPFRTEDLFSQIRKTLDAGR
jgi:two-component system, cell cycle sensor histidine kinase and response regulator CckA